MKIKFIVFMLISLGIFCDSIKSMENAVKHYNKYKFKRNFDIRTASQLKQPNETITTINYKGRSYSGYTSIIKENEEYVCRITLFKGFEYIIIGAGDDNSEDIDLFVYDEQGNTVAMDRNKEAYAYARLSPQLAKIRNINNDINVLNTKISVRPLKTQKYWVKIKLRKAKGNSSSVGFIIGNRKVKTN
jgi:hypothetical protein